MKILFVSDFTRPGGYATIGGDIAECIHNSGHFIKMLGNNYDKQQHEFSYGIIPTHTQWLPQHILALSKELKPDWILLMMDIPRQISVVKNLKAHDENFSDKKFAAMFPVESDPMSSLWADALSGLYKLRFTFTNFGVTTCAVGGVSTIKIPVGMSEFWRRPSSVPPDKLKLPERYVLTVADNQIRKNIPAAMRIMSQIDMPYVLVTKVSSPDGWNLLDLRNQIGISSKNFIVIDSAQVSNDVLKIFYDHASAFLLTSLAEGIGLPVYEVQIRGIPAVTSNCCGLPEAVVDSRYLIRIEYVTPYPWGNTNHYWVSIKDGVDKVKLALSDFEAGRFVTPELPSWEEAAKIIIKSLEEYKDVPQETEPGPSDSRAADTEALSTL